MYYKCIKYTIIAFVIPIGIFAWGYIYAEQMYSSKEGMDVERLNKSIEACMERKRNSTSPVSPDCIIAGMNFEKFEPWMGNISVLTMEPEEILEERRSEQIDYYSSISANIFLLIIILSVISLLVISSIKVINRYEQCPYCAKYIKVEAKVCQHCGNELPEDQIRERNK